MRSACVFFGAVLFLAVPPSALLCQQFQDPTPDELKMTADPKAPGADAVYLNVVEIDNDPLHFRTYYARIKILTEKGKELATVTASFLKGDTQIREVHGRTIHSDGTVIPLNVKPEDLLFVKSGDIELKQKVFTLPSVEVGSILEYRYDLLYPDKAFSSPQWEIQRPYFVHKAHFVFTPLPDFMPRGTTHQITDTGDREIDARGREVHSMSWSGHLPPGAAFNPSVNGTYTLDVTDIPPIPDEALMPPVDTFLYRLFFYYLAAFNSNDFWQSEGKGWSKDVDRFAEPSTVIHTAVDGIVAPGDSDLDKAKKLYAAVQALDNTDYSREKTKSERHDLKLKTEKHAEDTWTQKSGDSEDIAMLYLAMLRAASLKAYAAKLVDRDRAVFDPSYLSLDQLDSTVVLLNTGGQQMVLDPGEKMCPFGTVSWRHSYAGGLGQSAEGPSFTTTPMQQYAGNTIRRTGVLALDEKGGVSGQLQIAMTGQEALRWRQTALENDETEVKKEYDADLVTMVPDGVQAHVDRFEAMDDPNTPLIAVVNVSGTLGVAAGKRLVLPGFFFETHGPAPFVNVEKRIEPVDMHYAERVTDQINYRLPAGMTVEGAPQDVNIAWPNHALLVAKSLAQPTQITVAQTLTRAFTLAKSEEYQELRGFYQKVAAADQGQIVLAAGKGN